MNLKEMCTTCCGLFKEEKKGEPKRRISIVEREKAEFCSSAFLPDCVRLMVEELHKQREETLPFSIRFTVILLSCEIPAIPEAIDSYSVSSSFPIINMVDELNAHFSEIIKRLVHQGGDIIQMNNGLIDCIWPVEEDSSDKSPYRVALNTALAMQKELGTTHTKVGCDLQNKIGIAVGDLDMLFFGTDRVYFVPDGNVLDEVRSAVSVGGKDHVIVSKSFWNHIEFKEYYVMEPFDDDFMQFSEPAISTGDESARELMVALIKNCRMSCPLLIGVDSAEHTGTESWLFLQCLLEEHLAVVVTTLTEEFTPGAPFVKHLMRQQYLGIKLQPILGEELGALACHVLQVKAIHRGFLDFLHQQSEGNALKLQEILMLPPLQKHFCLIAYHSIPQDTLREKFVPAEKDEDEETEDSWKHAKVCDILDAKGLWSIEVPKNLLDIVKDHTTGLNPEEQMLMRKCSLLGDIFGLRILEVVSPEYSSDELYSKVQNLVEKNILASACDHWQVVDSSNRRRITLTDSLLDYCVHPVRFVSDFLKRCVLLSMAEPQKQRMNLYLAELLRDETSRTCDSCRQEADTRMNSSQRILLREYKIPSVDFRLCRCFNLRTDMLIQVAFHLEKGNAPIWQRLRSLVEAAEIGLEAREIAKIEEILSKTRRLITRYTSQFDPDDLEIAIERLRAKLKLRLGKNDDALRCIKQAFLALNVIFPADASRGTYRYKKYSDRAGEEEIKCLRLGSYILLTLGKFDDAFHVAKLHRSILEHEKATDCQIIEAKTLYLRALAKSMSGKKRERACRKLINDIRQMCFKRLTEQPELAIHELRTIVRAFKILMKHLFITAELDAGAELGHKAFQILKFINHPKQLSRILFILANIYFYKEDYHKCEEMVSHLQDSQQQSGDVISDAMYYTILTKLTMVEEFESHDRVSICHDYAERVTASISCHPKHNNRIFCLSSIMALWCLKTGLEDSFPPWYDRAVQLKKEVSFDTYWTLSGSIYLTKIEIWMVQEKFFAFTRDEVASYKLTLQKTVDTLRRRVKKYVPVLEGDVKTVEKFLHNAFKHSKILKH